MIRKANLCQIGKSGGGCFIKKEYVNIVRNMVRKLESWEIDGRAHAQQADIQRRKDFLAANKQTQLKVVHILRKMVSLVGGG